MAVSPEDSEDLASEVADAYGRAEVSLIGRVAQFLGLGLDKDSWAVDRRDGAGLVRRAVGSLLKGLFSRGRKAAAQAAKEAERRGVAQADDELGALADSLPSPSGVPAKMDGTLHKVEQAMADQAMNVYHQVITKVSAATVDGTATRLAAAKRALAEFADRGITGFVDQAGRNWELRSYVEMAVRTHLANVMVDAHAERIKSAGVNLVMVSQAPYECKLCAKWEGKILTLDGPSGQHQVSVRNATGRGQVTVEVAGSLTEARSAGLFHPNCRHSVTAYLPGVTRAPEKPDTDGVTYADTQKLRYYERQARKWDRRRAVALTDEDRKAADAKFKAWRKQAADHAKSTGLPRKTNRERHDAVR